MKNRGNGLREAGSKQQIVEFENGQKFGPYSEIFDRPGYDGVDRYLERGMSLPSLQWTRAFVKAGGSFDSFGSWGVSPGRAVELETMDIPAEFAGRMLSLLGRADYDYMEIDKVYSEGVNPRNKAEYHSCIRGIARRKTLGMIDVGKSVTQLGSMQEEEFARDFNNYISLANTKMFLLEEGANPSNSIAQCLKAIEEDKYQVSSDWGSSISNSADYPIPGHKNILNISWKFQGTRFGKGFMIEPKPRSYTHEAYTWFFKKKVEKLYVTSSGAIILKKANEIFVSETKEKRNSVGILFDLAYIDLMRSLRCGLLLRNLNKGIEYNLGKYKVLAASDGISRRGNIKLSVKLKNEDGLKLSMGERLLSQSKIEKLSSTVLHGVKGVIREYEKLFEAGEDPEVAMLIAITDDKEAKRRVSFVRSHPELGISVDCAVCPGWSHGVVPINQITISDYDDTVVANAIGFIGEPEKPTDYSLKYKTREGAEKPWGIELSYSTPRGGGCYWFYLDGASADAHNGNLETLASGGDFGQYKGLLWMFLNPLKEELLKTKKQ